jgi:thymidylate kinase
MMQGCKFSKSEINMFLQSRYQKIEFTYNIKKERTIVLPRYFGSKNYYMCRVCEGKYKIINVNSTKIEVHAENTQGNITCIGSKAVH